jgi:hypothetical protein
MQFFLCMSSSVVVKANPADIGITLLFLCLLIKTTPAPVLFSIAVTPPLLPVDCRSLYLMCPNVQIQFASWSTNDIT